MPRFLKTLLPLFGVALSLVSSTGCASESSTRPPVITGENAAGLNDTGYAMALLGDYFVVVHPELSAALRRIRAGKKPEARTVKTLALAGKIVNGMVAGLEKRRPGKDFAAQQSRLITDLRQLTRGLALLEQGAKDRNESLVLRGRVLVDANLSDLVLLNNQLETLPP